MQERPLTSLSVSLSYDNVFQRWLLLGPHVFRHQSTVTPLSRPLPLCRWLLSLGFPNRRPYLKNPRRPPLSDPSFFGSLKAARCRPTGTICSRHCRRRWEERRWTGVNCGGGRWHGCRRISNLWVSWREKLSMTRFSTYTCQIWRMVGGFTSFRRGDYKKSRICLKKEEVFNGSPGCV